MLLNRLAPELDQAQVSAKLSTLAHVELYAERSASSFAAFGDIDLSGHSVLDVGCGLGANLMRICSLGARQVTGLDVDFSQVRCANTIVAEHYPELANRLQFVAADAACMPFPSDCFDVLISADTFEHIGHLDRVLRECARVLKPGRSFYLYFLPFYAPWGAHMVNWIRVPWCQVFFAESTLVNVARQLEQEGKSINSRLPQEIRLGLPEGDVIPFVSHLTIGHFQRTVEAMPMWRIITRRLLPPGWRNGYWIPKLLKPMTRVPVLYEMFVASAVFVLQKVENVM
jgi:ubiquinone/menaquinone biosynthesis C-methylase UbiE